ncbi:ThuA domain-containing protein [candidate division KSB1 bacterium]|nr:ThuA domain-containing protein [candidate division KSB1 bacterium]
MRLLYLFIAGMILMTTGCTKKLSVLVVTGGHEFEEAFWEIFASIPYDRAEQPAANRLIENHGKKYDVLVFYDMFQDITPEQKQAYLDLLNRGTGMVFLHHALVSYQNWDEFEKIIGGKYQLETKITGNDTLKASTYRHGVNIPVIVVNPAHPVTAGMEDFIIHDEVYGNYYVNNDIKPLLRTDHPESTPVIAWEHQYANSKIIYIQLGHDHLAYENPNYSTLVLNAVNYAAP